MWITGILLTLTTHGRLWKDKKWRRKQADKATKREVPHFPEVYQTVMISVLVDENKLLIF